jgi:hypothetical protein
MVLTRISLVIPLGMINVMQGTAQRQAACPARSLRGTGAEAGVDSAWEQKKLEARKLLEKAAREAPQRPVHAVLGCLSP